MTVDEEVVKNVLDAVGQLNVALVELTKMLDSNREELPEPKNLKVVRRFGIIISKTE